MHWPLCATLCYLVLPLCLFVFRFAASVALQSTLKDQGLLAAACMQFRQAFQDCVQEASSHTSRLECEAPVELFKPSQPSANMELYWNRLPNLIIPGFVLKLPGFTLTGLHRPKCFALSANRGSWLGLRICSMRSRFQFCCCMFCTCCVKKCRVQDESHMQTSPAVAPDTHLTKAAENSSAHALFAGPFSRVFSGLYLPGIYPRFSANFRKLQMDATKDTCRDKAICELKPRAVFHSTRLT